MNDIERLIADRVDNDNYQRAVSDDFSFADALIEQTEFEEAIKANKGLLKKSLDRINDDDPKIPDKTKHKKSFLSHKKTKEE